MTSTNAAHADLRKGNEENKREDLPEGQWGTSSVTELGSMIALPTTVGSKRCGIGRSESTTTTATTAATATTTATPTAVAAIATAATAEAGHLSETGINLLLSLSEDSDQVTSLLLV